MFESNAQVMIVLLALAGSLAVLNSLLKGTKDSSSESEASTKPQPLTPRGRGLTVPGFVLNVINYIRNLK